MHRRPPRSPWKAASAFTLVAVLAACSSQADSGGGAQELTVASPMSISSLDPHGPASGDRPTIMVSQHVFDSLVVREGTDFVPSLATAWENDDPLVWRFELNPDATFHDGTPVTAQDVVASQARLVELGGPLASQWAPVVSVEAEDDHTVVFTTETPVGTMLSNLALLFIAPADELDTPDFFNEPIGSGPFSIEQFRLNDRVELVVNDDYWGERPEIDRLIIRDMPETSSIVAAIETGEIDLTWGLPADQLAGLSAQENLTVETLPSFVLYMNWFNSSREPFDDPQVRRALWHAVDVESLVANLMPEAATVATAPIPSTVFGHSEQVPYAYDPDLARELLSDAGHPEGITATLDISTGGGPQIREIAQTMISDWRAAGIEVTLQEKERGVWLDDLVALEWDMNLLVNSVLTGDADFTLGRLYPSAAERTGYANPELDKILADAAASVDQDERLDFYDQANEIIWSDAVGIYPMDLLANYVWREGISGFEPDPNETPLFTGVSLD